MRCRATQTSRVWVGLCAFLPKKSTVVKPGQIGFTDWPPVSISFLLSSLYGIYGGLPAWLAAFNPQTSLVRSF